MSQGPQNWNQVTVMVKLNDGVSGKNSQQNSAALQDSQQKQRAKNKYLGIENWFLPMILWWSATVWTTSPSASPPLSPLSPLSSSRPAAATPSYLLWSCLAPFLNMVCVYTFPSGSEIFIFMKTYCFSSFANCGQVGLLAQHFFEI